ncbi:MAG: ABC transporter permease [Myxococcota bacterium]
MEITPLTQRRIDNFKANKRGYYSMWIVALLFLMALFAEFIANDKPILVWYEGDLYVPAFVFYPETEFGGEFETEAEYRDVYVQNLIEGQGGWMLWPPVRFSYDTIDTELGRYVPSPPSLRHWLGTDDTSRDVFARVLYGFRISLAFGLILTAMSSVVGVFMGAVQGYFGGLVDLLLQRFIEMWAGMPVLFVLIILASVLEPSFAWLLLILLLFQWVALVAVVRAEFLRARNFDYVRAARALGSPNRRIMVKHVLPNAMVATLTFVPFILTGAITLLTALDFLGLGLPIGSASLGEILVQGRQNVQFPWLGIAGFATLATMLSLVIFASEAARDAFDPRKTFP